MRLPGVRMADPRWLDEKAAGSGVIMRRLGLDLQTLFGMPPLEHVALAARLGCGHISTGLTPVPWRAACFPSWSLREDGKLRRELRAALSDQGLVISQAEGFAIRPMQSTGDYAADLDIVAELGAKAVSTVCLDPDRARGLDQFCVLADLASERGLLLHLEFAPPHPVNTLEKALTFMQDSGFRQARLVIDAMHFFRSGATLEVLETLSPELIGHIQLCDAPVVPLQDDYFREACLDRHPPGEGELPLAEFVKLLPRPVPVGLEVPMRSETGSREQLELAVTRTVDAARALLAG